MKNIFLLLLILVFSVSILIAEDIYVDQGGSIQNAINQATNNVDPEDTIILTGTHYYISGTLTITTDHLTLRSNNSNPEDCVIDGNDAVNILDINYFSGFTLENICIQNGYSNDTNSAAGITYIHSWGNLINNCIIRDCNGVSSCCSGGIRSLNSSLTISNSLAENNYGEGYGFIDFRAIESGFQEDLIIYNSVIANNQGSYCGGIYGHSHSGYANLSIDYCLFFNNTGTSNIGVGAISWSGNSSTTPAEYVTITNTTISDNSGYEYGGIKINSNANYYVQLNVENCIIWGNSNQQMPYNENNTTVSYSDIQDEFTGTGNIDADPLFADPSGGDYQLTQLSPCIDVGNPTSSLDHDDTVTDMGCYYFHHDYDIKRFEEGIQWVSFPYLTQQGTSNGEIFEQVYYENGDPGLLQETSGGSPTINDFDIMYGNRVPGASIDYDDPDFFDINFGNMLFRHEGYKVKVTDGGNPTVLIVDGERLGSYTLDMPALENFWLGYYIPYPQNVEDAFGDDFVDVNRVWAEDWYYDKLNNNRGAGDPILPSNSTKGKTLEYGKMYIVQMHRDVYNFSWNGSNIVEEPKKKSKPENFNYTEKADYEVIDVVSIPSNVTEIGVFEDEICVGAIAVEDTCAQILVYSDNANRDPIPFTFEIVTGRGFSTPTKDYLVLNQMTGEFEPSVIISGRQGYSAIKFGEQVEPENIISRPLLNGNYPNPFNPTTTISFSVSTEQDIELTIYNIKGQKIKTLYSGTADVGEHTVIWEGKDNSDKQVSSGIYVYKLTTNNKELTRKMLMMK